MRLLHCLLVLLIIVCVANCAPSEERKGCKSKKNEESEIKLDNDDTIQGDKPKKKSKKKLSNSEKFEKQLKPLFKLGCEPTKYKVSVRSLLGPQSPLHDAVHVYPEFVVIKKCNASCSFCKLPGDDFGIESKVCLPKKSKKKRVLVKFRNLVTSEWKYKTLKTQQREDKECECVSKEDITSEIPPDEKAENIKNKSNKNNGRSRKKDRGNGKKKRQKREKCSGRNS